MALTAFAAIAGTLAGVKMIKSPIGSYVTGQPSLIRFVKYMTSLAADDFVTVVSLPALC